MCACLMRSKNFQAACSLILAASPIEKQIPEKRTLDPFIPFGSRPVEDQTEPKRTNKPKKAATAHSDHPIHHFSFLQLTI